MSRALENIEGLVPIRLRATPTYPLERAIGELLSKLGTGHYTRGKSGRLNLLSRRIEYLDLNAVDGHDSDDAIVLQKYSEHLSNYTNRLYQISSPTSLRLLGNRGIQAGVTMWLNNDYETSLVMKPPFELKSGELIPDYAAPGLEMYTHIRGSKLAESAIKEAFHEFASTVASSRNLDMQVTNLRVDSPNISLVPHPAENDEDR